LAKVETEDVMRNKVIIDFFAFIFMSFYTTLPITMKATILLLILRHLSMKC